jgi:PAS domain S-box-containing protein
MLPREKESVRARTTMGFGVAGALIAMALFSRIVSASRQETARERGTVASHHRSDDRRNLRDLEGRFLLINRHHEELFSVTREQARGRLVSEVFPKQIAAKFLENNQLVLQAGRALEFEEVAPHKDGLHTYISIKFPLVDANKSLMQSVEFQPTSRNANVSRTTCVGPMKNLPGRLEDQARPYCIRLISARPRRGGWQQNRVAVP